MRYDVRPSRKPPHTAPCRQAHHINRWPGEEAGLPLSTGRVGADVMNTTGAEKCQAWRTPDKRRPGRVACYSADGGELGTQDAV